MSDVNEMIQNIKDVRNKLAKKYGEAKATEIIVNTTMTAYFLADGKKSDNPTKDLVEILSYIL